jgi:hypothetical protein
MVGTNKEGYLMAIELKEFSQTTPARSTSGSNATWEEFSFQVPDAEVWYIENFQASVNNFQESYGSSDAIWAGFGLFQEIPGTNQQIGTYHKVVDGTSNPDNAKVIPVDKRFSGVRIVVRTKIRQYSSYSGSFDSEASIYSLEE